MVDAMGAATGVNVLAAMQAAAVRLWSPASFWHVGGLAWQRADITSPTSKVHLHTSGGAPTGWGWVEDGTHLNALVIPGDDAAAANLVEWFVAEAPTDTALTAVVPRSATGLASALLEMGFAAADGVPFSLDMRRGTATVPDAPLPDGFTLRALAPDEDGALVACHRAAWDPHTLPWAPASRPVVAPGATSHFSEEALAQVFATWPFRRELVCVVEAPDGTLAASCIAWLDDVNAAAEIEPLGVVPAYRGLGLGRALCLGAVRAVGRHGGVEVVIHPRGDDAYPAAHSLYATCGFRSVSATRPLVRAAGHDHR